MEIYGCLYPGLKPFSIIRIYIKTNIFVPTLYVGSVMDLCQNKRGTFINMDYIDTNNTIINSILNVKYQEAMDAGILFISRINDLSAIKLDSEEVVMLLSNLLNNAIEACEKCNGQKIIKVKCTNDSDNFIIAIKNTYDGAIKKQGEEIVTTKNKNVDEHGFGLKNVRQIVENNNGYMDIEYDEKEFSVSVIIPN